MHLDAPALLVLAPLMFVAGVIYLLGPMLPIARPWARLLVFATVWLIVAHYLNWRLFTTVMPAQGQWYEVGWVWFCFAIELFAIGDALILYLTFLRTADRRGEADVHEKRLRTTAAQDLPSVDVYIPTYNEPFDVLEKTVTAALCLDYPNFKVWVLDDGRRAWLRDFCREKGVGYITRPDNAHAKAGNINHALTKTEAEFVALFDADFIVQREFLTRTIGFFLDPQIGIVQVPHTFYNHDPMQTNLALRKTIPDDQRFFFESIMPSRDAWNAAFCCGSNSVTRRAALRAIGDALPTQSITEDMLLTLMLLRKGYVTRYLCEPLAYGLAPEGLQAFFIQRRRWARGAMQILYLPMGPLGKGLTLMQHLLFLPTHWLSQSLTFFMAIMVPLVFLWTGVLPMANVTLDSVLHYIVPMMLAVVGGICIYAPKSYFPFAVQVLGTFQSFKLLPSLLMTLVKPFGHRFKVTPKGGAARAAGYDQQLFWIAAGLMALTAMGVVINTVPEWRIVEQGALVPIAASWAAYNIVVLFLVCMMSLQASAHRLEERFTCDEPVWIIGPGRSRTLGRMQDISLSGAGVHIKERGLFAGRKGEHLRIFVSEVGLIKGRIARGADNFIGIEFELPTGLDRDLLIRRLFTSGLVATTVNASAWTATVAVLRSIWHTPTAVREAEPNEEPAAGKVPVADKLPAVSAVISPSSDARRWAALAAERRAVA